MFACGSINCVVKGQYGCMCGKMHFFTQLDRKVLQSDKSELWLSTLTLIECKTFYLVWSGTSYTPSISLCLPHFLQLPLFLLRFRSDKECSLISQELSSSTITRDCIVNHSPFVAHEGFPALKEGSRNKISGVHSVWFGCSVGRYWLHVLTNALQLCLHFLNSAPGGKLQTYDW